MSNLSLVLKLQNLFKGRTDYCLVDGSYTVQKLVTSEDFEKHLNGQCRLGIFPVVEDKYTHFFVFDIDTNDSQLCDLIHAYLGCDGLIPYVEKSKSKGYHVWVFLSRKILCSTARLYMKKTLKALGYNENKIDLFPRQDTTGPDSPLGNAINLPLFNLYNDKRTSSNRFIDERSNLIQDQESYLQDIVLSDPTIVEGIVGLIPQIAPEVQNPIEVGIDLSHEEVTLQKLISVCAKTRSIKSKVVKAEKTTRSIQDVIYAKHLGELLFSEQLIESEIKQCSQKYNDPSLRGRNKENYLRDKSKQMKFLRDIFNKDLNLTESSGSWLFKYTDEFSEPYLVTKKIADKKIGKIEEPLLSWLEIEAHQIKEEDFFVISAGCGAGKSNVIKQLGLSVWKYNKNNSLENKDVLICVERIQDGVYLEKFLDVYRLLRVFSDNGQVKTHQEIINDVIKYTDSLSKMSLHKMLEEDFPESLRNKLQFGLNEKSSDVVFKCAPNEKICLEGYSEQDLQNNACKECQNKKCPASPMKNEIYKKATVAIATQQSFIKGDEWGTTRRSLTGGQRALQLIDEKPDVLKSHTLFLKKKGNFFETSIDVLIEYLKLKNETNLYVDVNDNFLGKIKNFYTKSKKSISKLNSGNQTYDVYKSYDVPTLSIKSIRQLENIRQRVWQDSMNVQKKRKLSEIIDTLIFINGKDEALATMSKRQDSFLLNIELLENRWEKVNPDSSSAVIVFDATASIDPCYLVSNAPKIKNLATDLSFPNLKIIFYEDRDIHKGKVSKQSCDSLFNYINNTHLNSKKLIVHSKDVSTVVENSLNSLENRDTFFSDHFNNLKGKNDYIDCNIIVFTNLLRRSEMNYLLLAKEIWKNSNSDGHDFKIPSVWSLQRGKDKLVNVSDSTLRFNDEFLDNVRTSVDVVDIIQTIFRISLRRDSESENYVYLPISSSGLLKKIIHYFKDAKIERMNI